MKKAEKRKYNKRMQTSFASHHSHLIEMLREEWKNIERAHKKKERQELLFKYSKEAGLALAKAVLVLAALGGIMTIAVVAPNIVSIFSRGTKYKRFFRGKELRESITRLKAQGLINYNRDTNSLRLTNKGLGRVREISFEQMKIEKTHQWDGTWRIAMFDIPDRHKWSRDSFRRKLRELNFYQFQKSVFVIPYPCLNEIKFLASFFNISAYVHFLETANMSGDSELREFFDL